MTSGAHHHLKRLNAPSQWGLDKWNGKYAVRPLPGPHTKGTSIPLRYIIAKFLKVASTSREIDYILSNKMISINGKEIECGKFPVGLFDVITIKKTNSHFRLYFASNKKFAIRSITSDESQFRIAKVMGKHTYNQIPLTRTSDGFNFKFVDPSIIVTDTVKIDIKNNTIVSRLSVNLGALAYVYGGFNCGRIGIIKRIDVLENGSKSLYLEDKLGKAFSAPLNDAIIIGENSESSLISFETHDGIRLNTFEKSNLLYAETAEPQDDDE